MKLYNPFKWHVVEKTDEHGDIYCFIRRFNPNLFLSLIPIIGWLLYLFVIVTERKFYIWEYKDTNGYGTLKNSYMFSHKEVYEIFIKIEERKKNNKSKVLSIKELEKIVCVDKLQK